MMSTVSKFMRFTLALAAGTVLLVACKAKGDFPGRTYMPDMQYSNAYETYAGNISEFNCEEHAVQTARKPPKGTIPHGSIPADESIRTDEGKLMSYVFRNYFYGFAQDSTYTKYYNLAQTKLVNPVPASDATMKRGKEMYTIYCQVCHGEKGGGDGTVPVISGDGATTPYPRPPDYKNRLPQLTDGNMYFTITYGVRNMGSYAAQIKPEDRWCIVHYIKSLAGIKEGTAPIATDSTTANP